jgi:3-oxoacyl-[acyl-carrier protein] reductase
VGGRIALVTGGWRGIGRACAVALARDGHRVAVCYAHDDAAAGETREAIEAAGGEALVVKADVADPAAVDAAFGQVEAAWGRVEVLVVNAGINRDGLLLRMSDEQWRAVVDTDLGGAFHAVRRVAAGMVRGRWGRIVLIGSVVGFSGSGGQVNYGAAKAGLVGLARSTTRELGSRNITVNVVAPGPITTAMTDALTEERRAELARQVPLGRFGTADEVAAVVAFLCSDGAGYISGAVVPVDGGMGMGH